MDPISKASWLKFGAIQGKEGVEFDVWAHPSIEAYFKSVSTDRFDVLDQTGYKKWWSGHGDAEARKNFPPLKISRLKDNFLYTMEGRGDYSFQYNGYPMGSDELPKDMVNLAFLRIPGISEGEGIKFTIEGVVSNQLIREMKAKTGHAVRSFVKEYLVPVRFELEIIGREIS